MSEDSKEQKVSREQLAEMVRDILHEQLPNSYKTYREEGICSFGFVEEVTRILKGEIALDFIDASNYCSDPFEPKQSTFMHKCKKELNPGQDIGYQCIDCAILAEDGRCNSLICSDCFRNSVDEDGINIHAANNHRVMKMDAGGICDCGDPTMWKSESNCKLHKASEAKKNLENGVLVSSDPEYQTLLSSCYLWEYVFPELLLPLFEGIQVWWDSSKEVPFWAKGETPTDNHEDLRAFSCFCLLEFLKLMNGYLPITESPEPEPQEDENSQTSQVNSEMETSANPDKTNDQSRDHQFHSILLGLMLPIGHKSGLCGEQFGKDCSLLRLFLRFHMSMTTDNETNNTNEVITNTAFVGLNLILVAGLGFTKFKTQLGKEYLFNMDSLYAFREGKSLMADGTDLKLVNCGLSPVYKLFSQLFLGSCSDPTSNKSLAEMIFLQSGSGTEGSQTKLSDEMRAAIEATNRVVAKHSQIDKILLEFYLSMITKRFFKEASSSIEQLSIQQQEQLPIEQRMVTLRDFIASLLHCLENLHTLATGSQHPEHVWARPPLEDLRISFFSMLPHVNRSQIQHWEYVLPIADGIKATLKEEINRLEGLVASDSAAAKPLADAKTTLESLNSRISVMGLCFQHMNTEASQQLKVEGLQDQAILESMIKFTKQLRNTQYLIIEIKEMSDSTKLRAETKPDPPVSLEKFREHKEIQRGFLQPLMIFWKEVISSSSKLLSAAMSDPQFVSSLVSIVGSFEDSRDSYPNKLQDFDRAMISYSCSYKVKCMSNLSFGFQEIFQAMIRSGMSEAHRQHCCDLILKEVAKQLTARYLDPAKSKQKNVLDLGLERLLSVTVIFKYGCSKLLDGSCETHEITAAQLTQLNEMLFGTDEQTCQMVWNNVAESSANTIVYIKDIIDKSYSLVSLNS